METGLPGAFMERFEHLNIQQDILKKKVSEAQERGDAEAEKKYQHQLGAIHRGMDRLFIKHGAY